MTQKTNSERGFTISELLLVIVLTGIIATSVISFLVNFWGVTTTLTNDNETFVEREDAGDALRTQLNVAAHLINQNSIADAHALVPDPDAGSSYWLLIHAIPGTTTMPASGHYTPVFYFEAPSTDKNKNFIMNGSQPYYDEFVLYLNGTTKQLLLRTLANPNATGDRFTTSCPASLATGSCPADLVMSGDVSSVDLNYFSKSGNPINWTSSTDPVTGQYNGPDFPVVEVVSVTLHLQRLPIFGGGSSTINETVIRVALRN